MLAVTALINESTITKAFVPPNATVFNDIGLDWNGTDPSFDDSAWLATNGTAPNGVGFPDGVGGKYDEFVGLNLQPTMLGISRSAFVRIPFTASDIGSFNALTLKMRFEDGFIAYLNGVEVFRQNVTTATTYPAFDVGAAASAEVLAGAAYTTFDISQHLSALQNGANVLAIRGFNVLPAQTDFLVQAALDGITPDLPAAAVNDSATVVSPATSTVINVLANDTPGSLGLNATSVQVVTQPANGTVAVNPTTGAITYTATAGTSGIDTFTYRVRDNNPLPTPGGGVVQTTVVGTNALHQRLVPTAANAALGTTWTGLAANEPFVTTGWTSAIGGVGYDNAVAVDYTPFIGDNVATPMFGINGSVYTRIPFTITDPASVVGFRLRMRNDDGFIAYINGVQVAAIRAPATPAWNSVATAAVPADADALVQQEFVIPITGLALRTGVGNNILAIHGLNATIDSSDLLAQAELIAETGTTGVWTNEATVTVDVKGPGPSAAADSGWVQAETAQFPDPSVTVNVLANDTIGTSGAAIRPDTVAIATPPANGTTQIDPATGAITYFPNAGFSGDDVFTYTVRDAAPVGGTSTATFKARGTTWKYLDTGVDQGTNWRGTTFNDASWASGLAELGYADAPVTTVSFGPDAANKYITTYFRSTFDLTDPDAVQMLNVLASYDDGIVIYINGVEVARSANMPAGNVVFGTLATPDHEGGTFETLRTLQKADLTMLRTGTNVIAAEVHQNAPGSSDLTFDLELTGNLQTATGYVSNPGQVRIHVNAPPVAGNDAISIGPQGTNGLPLNSITFNPLVNDSDPNHSPGFPAGVNPATVVISTPPPPNKGTVSVNPVTGAITYSGIGLTTPQTVTFQYTVRDFQDAVSLPATVTVSVVVKTPQVAADTAVTAEDTPVTINVQANDVRGDLPINVASVFINSQPANGTIQINTSTGAVIYTPNPGFADAFDTFTYSIADISGNRSTPATVTVDVFSRAVARPDGLALAQGETVLLIPFAQLWANDKFPTATFQPAVVVVPNSATKGTATVVTQNGQQFVQFTKANGATGVATFSYYLQDIVPSPTRPNSNNAEVSIALGAINISGKVYVDVNRDNVHNLGEALVPNATIVLTRAGDPNFRITALTGDNPHNANYGQYSFVSTSAGVLPPDIYTITEIQPSMYLDFTTGAVNSYTVNLTAQDNPGYDFREWTVNPQFFTMLASYGGGFLASQQPVSLSANSIVVPYDQGWNGAFTAKATYNATLGPVSVKLYNSAGAVVANSATNPNSTAGNAVVNYAASPSQKLVLVVSGTNPNVLVESPNLGTAAGDTMAPYVVNTSLASSRWSSEFRENLAGSYTGSVGYNVDAGETLPWQGLDQITMRFTEPVSVSQQDLRLWGVAVQDYRTQIGIQGFYYDPMTFTATWTLSAPIATDQLRVGLSDAVRDVWGNRVGGTGFEMLFNVLPGAVQASSGISSSEAAMAEMMSRQFARIGSEKYAPQFDFDGNGTINFVDAITLRNASGTELPAGTPGNGTTSTPSPQAPAAVIATAPRNAAVDAAETPRLAATSTIVTARRQVTRGVRAAAVDAAVSTSGDAGSNSGASSTTSSLSAIRARRAARTVDQALAALGSM